MNEYSGVLSLSLGLEECNIHLPKQLWLDQSQRRKKSQPNKGGRDCISETFGWVCWGVKQLVFICSQKSLLTDCSVSPRSPSVSRGQPKNDQKWHQEKVLPQRVEPFSIMSAPYTFIIQLISERSFYMRFYDQLSYGLWLINASCCIQCSWPLCASLFKAPHCHYSLFLVTFCTLENTSRICFLSALTLVFHDARTPAAAVSGVRFSGTRGDS